jgi:hypothetical protein
MRSVKSVSIIQTASMLKKIHLCSQRLSGRYYNYLLKLSKKLSRAGLNEFLEDEFSKISTGTKVLTIGSGGEINDLLNSHASLNDFEVTSFDIDQNRRPDILGDVCTKSLGFTCYDVIVLCEVLEHLRSPFEALDNINNALKQKGKLILSAPFCLPIHDHPNDFFRFTRHGLELMLSKFSYVSVRERNNYFDAIDVIWMRLLKEDSKSALRLSYMILPIIFYLKRPITILLNKFVKSFGITTGYVATAIK